MTTALSKCVHKGSDGRWYVCTKKGNQFITPSKTGSGTYFGPRPDAWGYSYVRRSDALKRARNLFPMATA